MADEFPLVEDELTFLADRVQFAGGRILDVGCGAGDATRRLVQELGARSATGLEVSVDRVAANRLAASPRGVEFIAGRAEDLPFADASFDVVLMQKSLHHVPVERMDLALDEAARVLARPGALVVSEPVAAGPFDEIMRTFHDESEVRNRAQEALARAKAFERRHEITIRSPVSFADFSDFRARMMTSNVIGRAADDQETEKARDVYRAFADQGGSFTSRRAFVIQILECT